MFAAVILAVGIAADPAPATPREALRPFNLFVGSWKGTGYPDGTREERANGFWQEKVSWEWLFKKDDVALVGTVAGVAVVVEDVLEQRRLLSLHHSTSITQRGRRATSATRRRTPHRPSDAPRAPGGSPAPRVRSGYASMASRSML